MLAVRLKLSCLGFLFCLMYIFIIIIIYEFPSNRSFLLTRGMGRGGGGAEASDPRTCRAGLGQCPLRTFSTLFNLSTKNKQCFTFLVWLQFVCLGRGCEGHRKQEGRAVFSVRWGLGIFHNGICLFSVDERDPGPRDGEEGILHGGGGVVRRAQPAPLSQPGLRGYL